MGKRKNFSFSKKDDYQPWWWCELKGSHHHHFLVIKSVCLSNLHPSACIFALFWFWCMLFGLNYNDGDDYDFGLVLWCSHTKILTKNCPIVFSLMFDHLKTFNDYLLPLSFTLSIVFPHTHTHIHNFCLIRES